MIVMIQRIGGKCRKNKEGGNILEVGSRPNI